MMQKTIKPPPLCFSCGKNLPESDFDLFHELKRRMIDEEFLKNNHEVNNLKINDDKAHVDSEDDYESNDFFIDENAIEKIILDSKLSTPYIRRCCRSMFIGDAIEYRTLSALYDPSKICSIIDDNELSINL